MAGKTAKRQQYKQFRQENGLWSASKRERLCFQRCYHKNYLEINIFKELKDD